MRRSCWFLVLTVMLAGCDAFRAHPDWAAQAADIRLPPVRLAVVMASVKGLKPTRPSGLFAGRMWIDYTLATNLFATRGNYTDSAFIADVMWADITELRGVRWHDSLVSLRAHLSPSAVDSAFKAGDARQLQHILIRADSGSPDSVMRKARATAEQVLARLRKGEDFGKLASEMSDDPGSKFRNGVLPVEPRGRWNKDFDAVGWKLAPGQLSDVFSTRFGYHVMRRPTFKESETAFHDYLLKSAGANVDSTYFDSLPIRWHLEIMPKAPAIIRAAMEEPDAIKDSSAVLARYTGGVLPLSTLIRWSNALPIQFTERLGGQADSELVRFVHLIGQNVLLLKEADSAHVLLDADDWTSLKERYTKGIDSLRIALDVTNPSFADSAAAPGARERLVAERVDSLFSRTASSGNRLPPLPFQLGPAIRRRYPHALSDAGVEDALAYLRDINSDSAAAAAPKRMKPGAVPQGAGVMPTTNPAPVPLTPGKRP